MNNYMLFVYQRSGSILITNLLEYRSKESIEENKKIRNTGILKEPVGQLRSRCRCPSEHITGPNIIETIGNENKTKLYKSKFWYTYIWNWWGETNNHLEVPGPYDGPECQWRWGTNELSKLPGKNWKFAVQVRDPRTQIASVMNTKGELNNPLQISDPENYFITLCKGARNRYRIVLDCRNKMDNYFVYKFEDMVNFPIETVEKLFNFYELEPDIESIKQALENNYKEMQRRVDIGKSHSSFGTSKSYTKRHKNWTDRQRQLFMDIVGKELEELGYSKEEEQ